MEKNPFEAIMTVLNQEMENRIYERLSARLKQQQQNKKRPETNGNTYITIKELCDLTGLKKATIYAKRSRRELPAYKFGRELRFKRSEVDAWIKSKQLTCLKNREGGEK